MLLMCLVACSAVAAMLAAQNPAAANIHMLTPDEMMDIGLRLGTLFEGEMPVPLSCVLKGRLAVGGRRSSSTTQTKRRG